MSALAGRIALVTGASGGIGAAVARALAADGALVALHHRRGAKAVDKLASELALAGGRAEPVAFDVRSTEAVNRAVADLVARHGRLDVVVNAAALVADAPLVMLDDGAWTDVIDTNLGGTFRVCRAAARAMIGQRRGSIVNVGSVAGLRASPTQANYAASKGGLQGLTRTLARELAPQGVRVNLVIPGLIDVGMTHRTDRRHVDAVLARVPTGRMGTAAEVANVVSFLASDASAYVVGAEIVVDGGLSL